MDIEGGGGGGGEMEEMNEMNETNELNELKVLEDMESKVLRLLELSKRVVQALGAALPTNGVPELPAEEEGGGGGEEEDEGEPWQVVEESAVEFYSLLDAVEEGLGNEIVQITPPRPYALTSIAERKKAHIALLKIQLARAHVARIAQASAQSTTLSTNER